MGTGTDAGAVVDDRPFVLALAGNPNVGKSALFNALTGLRQRVANYPGVTVERREGRFRAPAGRDVRVLDLPGTVSLVARSEDEAIAARVLGGDDGQGAPDVVVAVIDAGQVRRGLFLVGQILELGRPVVVALNMMDEARREGLRVSADGLSAALGGIPVVETVGVTGEGLEALVRACLEVRPPAPPPPGIPGLHGLPAPGPARWRALRDAVSAAGLEEVEVQARWRWVSGVLARVEAGGAARRRSRSDRIDRWLLHPVLGPTVFVGVMGAVFQAVFSLAETPMEAIESLFAAAGEGVRSFIPPGIFSDFLADGVIAGVGSVAVFLPQIVILFFFLGFLEDTGYMTRAAFLVDRPFRAVGLSGRSFIPLLSSYACAVPGILATRCIEDRRERTLAILVAPLMTCSARLPVYTVLIAACVPQTTVLGFLGLQGIVLLGLYLLGMVLAAGAALVADRWLLRGARKPPVIEHAPYRMPGWKAVLVRLGMRAGQFLRRAGTVILVASMVIWALSTFPRRDPVPGESAGEARSAQLSGSLAGSLGRAIEPVLRPLGFDWRIGIGLIGSLAAREVFVSTMSVVHAVEGEDDEEGLVAALRTARRPGTGAPLYDLPTVIALLLFYAVALQCMSTVAVILRETGSWRLTVAHFAALTVLAWGLAFAGHAGARFLGL